MLQRCLHDSIGLQKDLLDRLAQQECTVPVTPQPTPLASSTPYGVVQGQCQLVSLIAMHPCLVSHLLWIWLPWQMHLPLCFTNHSLSHPFLLQTAPYILRSSFSHLTYTEPPWILRIHKFSLSSYVSFQKSQENGLPSLSLMWPLGLSSVSFLRQSFCLRTIKSVSWGAFWTACKCLMSYCQLLLLTCWVSFVS